MFKFDISVCTTKLQFSTAIIYFKSLTKWRERKFSRPVKDRNFNKKKETVIIINLSKTGCLLLVCAHFYPLFTFKIYNNSFFCFCFLRIIYEAEKNMDIAITIESAKNKLCIVVKDSEAHAKPQTREKRQFCTVCSNPVRSRQTEDEERPVPPL